MFAESSAEHIVTHPLFAVAAIVIVTALILLASLNRKYALFGYLFLLPLASMPMFSGRLAGIPGFSVQNVIAALGIYTLFVTRTPIGMEPKLRTAFIFYWCAVALVVMHGALYISEIKGFYFHPRGFNLYYYFRSYLFVPILVGIAFVLAYRYASAGMTRAIEFLRYMAIATIGFGAIVLGSAAFYSSQYSNFNVVRDMMHDLIGQHSNDYSLAFAMLVPLLLAAVLSRNVVRGGDRRLFVAAIGIAVASVLFAYSRSGYLVLLLSVFGFALMTKKAMLLPLIALTVLLLVFAPESVIERAQTGFVHDASEGTATAVSNGRLQMWEASIDLVANNIGVVLFGGGRLTFPRFTIRQFGVDSPHSAYVEVLLDAGIIGAIPIFGFFLLIYLRARRALRDGRGGEFRYLYTAAVVALASYLLLATTGRSFFPSFPSIYIWQISGFILGLYRFETSQRIHRATPSPALDAKRTTPAILAPVRNPG
jgi:O-antigen ligase